MKLFLCVLPLFALCGARKVPVGHKLAKMQEDLDFLRFSAIDLRDDVELLLTWRNATLASEVLGEGVSKAGRIGVRGILKKTEITTMIKDDYANLTADMKGQINYFVRGLEAEKVALREMVQGVKNETKMVIDKMVVDVKGISTKTELSQNTVEYSLKSIFSNMTKATEMAEERINQRLNKFERDLNASFQKLSETQEKFDRIDSKTGKIEQELNTKASEDKISEALKKTVKLMTQLDLWLPFQNSLYRLFKDKKSHADAMAVCAEFGAHLVLVNKDDEMKFLISKYGETGAVFWIDGTDSESEGDWRFSNGERMTYTNWRPNEPNNYENKEDCIESSPWRKSLWNDHFCGALFNFVCEIDSDDWNIINLDSF